VDVVYVCRDGANEELRYSLRSLANVPHDRVWIFGGWPRWVSNVTVVATPQRATKYAITTNSLRVACEHPEVSDPFWLWNDDMYAIAATEPKHYDRGPVRKVLDIYQGHHPNSSYTLGMKATLAMLKANGHPDPLSFELHIPLVVHKATMLKAIEIGADIPVHHKRTTYGALLGQPSETVPDVKVYERGRRFPDGPWASSSDKTIRDILPHLRDRFPRPGRHEG
jgi:hypothetical protein